MRLSFYGGTGTVTGANFLLEDGDFKILVDCGLEQGSRFADLSNREDFPYDPASIKMLFVTHSHIDHIGRIPKLVKDGFRGVIYSTPETLKISRLLLDDALMLLDQEARHEGILPLYEKKDVESAMSLWQEIAYHSPRDIGNDIKVNFKDVGHVLGASMIEFTKNGRKIVFTGDLGNTPTPLLKDTEEITDANYMIMESVYGDRNHEPKDERRNHLRDVIKKITKMKGTLLIPAFSLERTQVLLYEINNMVEGGEIESIPVFLDSPLAIKVTDIYKHSFDDFNSKVQEQILGGDDIFKFPKLKFTLLPKDSQRIISTPNPKIVIAGSGMSTGGRIISHEKNYLSDPNNTILFIGYQAPGSLGRIIQDGAKEVDIYGEKIKIRANIESISGYSSHKDSEHLIEFVSKTVGTVEKVFVVMGEPKSALFLTQRLRDYLNVDAVAPSKGESFGISF